MDSKNVDLPSPQFSHGGLFLPCEFKRRYLSHLLPALKRIQCKSAEESNSKRVQVVKLEVDMALALSAYGFSWSDALRGKLLGEVGSSSEDQKQPAGSIEAGSSSIQSSCPSLPTQNINFMSCSGSKTLKRKLKNGYSLRGPRRYTRFNHCEGSRGSSKSGTNAAPKWRTATPKSEKGSSRRKKILKIHFGKVRNEKNVQNKFTEEMDLNSRIKTLRDLTPGGNAMETDVLIGNLESYIICLKMQVRILHYLADRLTITLPNNRGMPP